jgi:hypothetical protein
VAGENHRLEVSASVKNSTAGGLLYLDVTQIGGLSGKDLFILSLVEEGVREEVGEQQRPWGQEGEERYLIDGEEARPLDVVEKVTHLEETRTPPRSFTVDGD